MEDVKNVPAAEKQSRCQKSLRNVRSPVRIHRLFYRRYNSRFFILINFFIILLAGSAQNPIPLHSFFFTS
jgi:hypothetical protein